MASTQIMSRSLANAFCSLVVASLLLALLPLSNAGSAEAVDNVARLAQFRAIMFSEVKSAEVAMLDSKKPHGLPGLFKSKFHGRVMTTHWQKITGAEAGKMALVLRGRIAFWVHAYANAGPGTIAELSSFCIPNPGYAIHLETDQGTRDFLVCFECGIIDAFGDQADRTHYSIEYSIEQPDSERLRSAYEEEFKSPDKTKKKPNQAGPAAPGGRGPP